MFSCLQVSASPLVWSRLHALAVAHSRKCGVRVWRQNTLLNHICSDRTRVTSIPKLLLIGDADNFCSMQTFSVFAERIPGSKTVQIAEGYDHFRIYSVVRRALQNWAQNVFQVPSLAALRSPHIFDTASNLRAPHPSSNAEQSPGAENCALPEDIAAVDHQN